MGHPANLARLWQECGHGFLPSSPWSLSEVGRGHVEAEAGMGSEATWGSPRVSLIGFHLQPGSAFGPWAYGKTLCAQGV
jgi:hypothetical protein